ncbi:MAG: DUF2178 domain-containing protein [Acidobacteriota bacterium]
MDDKKAKFFRLFIVMIMAAAISSSVVAKKPLIVVAAASAGSVLIYLFGRQPTTMRQDERILLIVGKASRASFVVFGVGASILGAVLAANDKPGSSMYTTGVTISLAVTVLMCLYLAFYAYFNHKY